MDLEPDRVEREPDQEDILATALYLSQERKDLRGMTAEMWVETAIDMRQRIKAITGVYYAEDEIVEELAKP